MSGEGYWAPHTSSIDFCEKNYEHSQNVVELHNTWSSLVGIALLGLIGMLFGNPTKEMRYTLGYFILFIIGVGSAGLHGTLHWVFQSSDELPMIYLVVVMNFMAVEFDSPLNKPKYPRLPIILTILMVINTLVYYKFQHLYLVFIGTYAAASSYHIYLVYKLIYATNAGGQVSRKLCQNSQISYLGVGFPLWLVDMFHCDWFLDNLSGHSLGMTFHVIWHFGAGYGAYLGIVSLENCRARALGLPCRLEYILGCIPYMAVDEKATKGD